MKKLIFIIVLVFSFSPAYADDMQKYLSHTQDLARQGKYQEALERFLWFHDHALEHNRAMYGVRLSFALSYWKQLGDVYPPALEALKKTRDDKTTLLLAGKGNRELFNDVASINSILEDSSKTVDLFRTLDRAQGTLAASCWDIAKEAIIKAKDYDLVRKYIGNPVSEFGKIKKMYEMNTQMYGGKNFGASFKAYNENNFVKEVIRLIDVAVVLNDMKAAKEIQAKALTILDDYRLRDAIQKEKQNSAK